METLKTELKKACRTFEILKWIERAVTILAILLGLDLASEYMQLEHAGTLLALIVLLIVYVIAKVVLLYKKATIQWKLHSRVDTLFGELRNLQSGIRKMMVMQSLSENNDLRINQVNYLAEACNELIESWMNLMPQQEVSLNILQYVLSQLNIARKSGLSSANAAALSVKLLGLNMIITIEAAELMLHNDEVSLLS